MCDDSNTRLMRLCTFIITIKHLTAMCTDVSKSGNGEPGTGNGERGTGNGERGTGNGERESGNECTAVIPIRIQNRLFNAP